MVGLGLVEGLGLEVEGITEGEELIVTNGLGVEEEGWVEELELFVLRLGLLNGAGWELGLGLGFGLLKGEEKLGEFGLPRFIGFLILLPDPFCFVSSCCCCCGDDEGGVLLLPFPCPSFNPPPPPPPPLPLFPPPLIDDWDVDEEGAAVLRGEIIEGGVGLEGGVAVAVVVVLRGDIIL